MRRTLLPTVVLVGLLVGCSSHEPLGKHPTDPDKACRGGVPFFSASPPYAGPGRHLVIGLRLDDYDRDKYEVPDRPELPSAWAAEHDTESKGVFAYDPDEADYGRAQLALCMSGPRVTGTRLGQCEYVIGRPFPGEGGRPVDLVSAYYDFKVFEARSGRLITAFQLDGDSAYSCPQSIFGEPDAIAANIDSDALKAKLRAIVENRAPVH